MNPIRSLVSWSLTTSITLVALSPNLASAAGEGWLVDFAEAKELAADALESESSMAVLARSRAMAQRAAPAIFGS